MNLSMRHERALQQTWQCSAHEQYGIASGYPELDRQLPRGGFSHGYIYTCEAADAGASLQLTGKLLAQLTRGNKWVVLLAPEKKLLQQIQTFADVDRQRLLVVHTHDDFDTLWAAEQAMASHTCAAVFAWPSAMNQVDLRRLKLAARSNRAMGLMFLDAPDQADTININVARHGENELELAVTTAETTQLSLVLH